MTHKTESATSSPLSISGVESTSDVTSIVDIGEGTTPTADTLGSYEDALFDSGDGDIRLVVNGITLETHKYIIKRFSGLKNRIQNKTMILESNKPGAEDFQNTFKILYASVVEGPFEFDPLTLISALRVASTYDYPALRVFAIKHLEKISLSAVERIRLAREFGLPSWEEPAYVELCNREEAITKQEAGVLGLDAFVHVAMIREKEQRRRGKDIDAVIEGGGGAKTTQDKRKKRKARKPALVSPGSDSGSDEGGEVQSGEAVTGREEKPTETIPDPSFVNAEIRGDWREYTFDNFVLPVPGCECTLGNTHGGCLISPCVAKAVKHIQIQQLAHKNSISKLETTMDHVQVALLSFTPASESHAEINSNEFGQYRSVQEEVRKWLTSVGSPPRVA